MWLLLSVHVFIVVETLYVRDFDRNLPNPKKGECVMEPKYPEVEVQMTGEDGNCFAILGRVTKALRNAGIDGKERSQFFFEATAGDYDNLLAVCQQWVICQ